MKHLKLFNESSNNIYAKAEATLNEALVEIRDLLDITEESGQEYPNNCWVYRIKLGSEKRKFFGVYNEEELGTLKSELNEMSNCVELCKKVLKKVKMEGFTNSTVYINHGEINFQIQ